VSQQPGPALRIDASTESAAAKEHALRATLAGYGSAVIAFSGGVDSAYLASVAHDVLGGRALAVTADSASYPASHRARALALASSFGFRHEVIRTGEIERPEYRANPVDRCYYCKHELYTRLTALAVERGFAIVADGNNADDRADYRPGRKAAREFRVVSPLDLAGLTKSEIRMLSRGAGLPTWDLPASACLSSRIPYHQPVTDEKLRMIERAEEALASLGFRILRVRHHEDLARVELGPDELPRALAPDMRDAIVAALKRVGYRYVTLDLQGYRSGSLNEPIRLQPV
jgi:uncharacterized protein